MYTKKSGKNCVSYYEQKALLRASCRAAALVIQQVPVGSFRVFCGLLVVQEPQGGVEPALQFPLDAALGDLPVLLVDPLCLPGVSLDQLLRGPKSVIANPF